jgi:hypothetical protein
MIAMARRLLQPLAREVNLEGRIMGRGMQWQDFGNAAIGGWLVLSPWALGLQSAWEVRTAALVAGMLVVIVALMAASSLLPATWRQWLACAVGLGQMASPWLCNFFDVHPAQVNAVVTGFWIAVLSLWALIAEQQGCEPDFRGQAGLLSADPQVGKLSDTSFGHAGDESQGSCLHAN